jgi:hypothetical protein
MMDEGRSTKQIALLCCITSQTDVEKRKVAAWKSGDYLEYLPKINQY